jgi:hypothetical protein
MILLRLIRSFRRWRELGCSRRVALEAAIVCSRFEAPKPK